MGAAYLNESVTEAVARAAGHALDTPACVVDAAMTVRLTLGDADGAFEARVSRMLEGVCGEAEAAAAAAASSLCWAPCDAEGRRLCFIAAPEDRGELTAAYLRVLILAEYRAGEEDEPEEGDRKRAMLVSQLAGSGRIDSEADSYLSAFGYERDILRCAVLCVVETAEGAGGGAPFISLERWAAGAGILSSEDIYGYVNAGQMIVYKAVADADYLSYAEEIRKMAESMSAYLAERSSGRAKLFVYAGSAYPRASLLHKSYAEAAYLYSSRGGSGEPCLFINDFIFEWLYSNLDVSARRNLTRDISDALDENREIAATAVRLSLSDCSPIKCCEALGVHRNTVLQRMRKIKERTALDPLYSVKDRVALRACVIHRARRTVWNGGVIVQPDSVLSLSLRHLAELLLQKSGGSFRLDIHTVSTSGDNYKLLGMLMSGALNAVACSTIALCPYTDNKALTLHLPFLFKSADEAEYVVNGTVLPELRESLDKAGIICPCMWSMGWRYLTSRGAPIRVPSDLKGRRIRILASASIRDYFAGLGAVPLQIYYNNIKEALASNIINSQENPYKNILDMEFYKYQDYVTELPIWYSSEALCFSKRSWLELDAERQEMLREAVDETSVWVRVKQAEINAAAKEELIRLGMKVVVPTEQETAAWRESVRPLYEAESRREFLTKIMKAKRRYAKNGR